MICPSILSADFSDLKDTLGKLEESSVKVVHFDVMDNHFVPNLTFGAKFIKDLRKHSNLTFDVHLMIDNPQDSLDLYLDAGADLITVHYESTRPELFESMAKKVHEKGKKFGVSLKPATPTFVLNGILEHLDLILVMTVEPGFGGQKMLAHCLDKIPQIKKLAKENSLDNILIQVDGGITKDNLKEVFLKGCDWFVAGSAFFKEKDFNILPDLLNAIKKE